MSAKVLCTGVSVLALFSLAAPAGYSATEQKVTGPVARYWMDTTTQSGFAFGGKAPSMSDMMGMMGGGSKVSHDLQLTLSSTRAPAGAGKADHFVPASLGVGQSLPLTWTPPKAGPVVETGVYEPSQEVPKGKIYIFWGCGEKARPGQPLVIDLSKFADPKTRMAEAAKFTSGTPVELRPARKPLPYNSAGYGEWINGHNGKSVKGNASLVGAHTIKGNYSPDINFTLSQPQDFMPGLTMTSNAAGPNGSVKLGWQTLPTATGYIASTMGGGKNDTVVLWSSSDVQTVLFGMVGGMDYISPADAQRLVGQKVLLSPTTSTCQVPAEVTQLAPDAIYNITAFGRETDMAYPARPTDPKVAWNIEWTMKVRYRSSTGGILGQDMGAMMAGDDAPAPVGQAPADDGKKKKKKFGLGDVVRGASAIGF